MTTTESDRRPMFVYARQNARAISNGVALALVVLCTAYAAFTSQAASNRVVHLAEQRGQEEACISSVLFTTVQALNQRTHFTVAQGRANAALQQSQADFIHVILDPAHTEAQARDSLAHYGDSLDTFLRLVRKSTDKAAAFPYPAPGDFSQCLANARVS
jgi:hypothetical protein